MQPNPLSCWQCGTVLSTAGGRCPACGAEQVPSSQTSSARPQVAGGTRILRSRPQTDARPQNKSLPWVVLAVGLAMVGGLALALRPRSPAAPEAPPKVAAPAPAPSPVASAANPNDLGIADPNAVDPTELLGRAKTRALAWNRDSLLISLRAGPMVAGKVNLKSGATIEYWYGKPTGDGFGPGAHVAGKRFRIKVDASGTTASEAAGAGGRAALEPNCQLDEAVRKAQAAGIPATTPVTMTYEMNEKRNKPMWRFTVEGDESLTRSLDGNTCAIFAGR